MEVGDDHEAAGFPEAIHAVQTDWGLLVRIKPVLTANSKYLLTGSGNSIKVFSTTSGSLLEERCYHDAQVVGVISSKTKKDQFISCDENGLVCFWSHQDRKSLEKFTLYTKEDKKFRIASLPFCGKGGELFIVTQEEKQQKGQLRKYFYPYKPKKFVIISKDVPLEPNKIAVSVSGDHVAYVYPEALYVVGGHTRRRHTVGTRYLTCVTFHPSQDALATGDITGRILIWYEIKSPKPTKMELHWHYLPVADLAFSVTGNELYSGGEENVLVKWQLSEEKRSFLPRLGMHIRFVVTDITNTYIVTAQKDNAFSIISAKKYKAEGVIQGLAMNTDNAEPFPAGIAYDPFTRAVVLNGRTGHVQFYDLHHGKQLFHLDITMSNYYSRERYQKIYNTDVEKLAVSPDGCWLATVEYRDDHQSSMELRLKFWNFKKEDQIWYLNTSIEMPHDKYINGITFQPTPTPGKTSLCITCGEDDKFKIWKEIDNSDIYGKKSCWNCCGVGSYRHFPATAVSISPDGSLIAAGFGSILTFWLPTTCQLKGTLSQPYLSERIKQIEFGRGKDSGSLIVTRTKNWVCAWDLFMCTLSWRVSICSTCLAADPLSSYMAVFSESCDVFVFEPRSSELVSWQNNIDVSPAVSAVFVPHLKKSDLKPLWNEQSALIYINKNQMLKMLEVNVDLSSAKDTIAGRVKQLVQDTEAPVAPTPFAALVSQTCMSHSENKTSQSDLAAFGDQVEKSAIFIQEVLNEARVYRLDSFAHLTLEFCKRIIPEAVNSEEKQENEDLDAKLKEREEFQRKTQKKIFKRKRKDLQRVTDSDFSDLMSVLAI